MGAMGKGLLYQLLITPGMRCVAVADMDLAKALACVREFAVEYRVCTSQAQVNEAIDRDVLAVCEDGDLVARAQPMDALIESTSAISAAGGFAVSAIESGKHLILMNAEIDLIFGPYLMQIARDSGLTYASCDGDQHGVIRRLIDKLELWGFETVMGGNIKGFLDRYSNPTKIVPEADKRNLDYRMCTAYTDGTKLNIEMALLANALGYRTHIPGMHGPRTECVHDVLEFFPFREMWQPGGQAVVDYILGAQPDGGVFAVGYCDHPYQRQMLEYYKMGDGPFYVFYRPYHLCHVEAMQCVAEAVLDGRSVLEPVQGFRTNVFAYAKRDLRAGEVLDGIGGYTCYGLIENYPPDGYIHGVPICLAEQVVLKQDVAKDQRILLTEVDWDRSRFDFFAYSKALECSSGHGVGA
jgi:predicted homoserine dehydrogenase-like protein